MTNKTDKNSNAIRAAAQLQSEQTSTDTNKLSTYEVVFVLAQRSNGRVLIEAVTLEEARQKAREIELHAVANWEIFEDDSPLNPSNLSMEARAMNNIQNTNQLTKYHIISPNGFPLTTKPFGSKKEAEEFIPRYCEGLQFQGYYSALGCKIPLDVLPNYLRIVPEDQLLDNMYPHPLVCNH